MRFDDRLQTVLDSPAADAHGRAVRWRQLVDLISRARSDSSPELIERALDNIRRDAPAVPEPVRAATARAIAGRPLDARLIAIFAADHAGVAAPLLAGATLSGADRELVLAAASEDSRRLIGALFASPGDAAPAPEPEPTIDIPSISEVLARIEKLRASEADAAPPKAAPPEPAPIAPPPPATPPGLFRWECSPSGEIAWVEGAPRGALIGRSLVGADLAAPVSEGIGRAFARRSPFAEEPLTLGDDGVLAGDWRLSGTPAFSPADGRFIGYRGIARRPDAGISRPGAAERTPQSLDALRELVHEIKTPLNAIVGFAEIIDGQYLGPAHRRYRERAAEIVAEARILLEAVDDLDFAARLQSSRAAPGQGTEIAEIFPRMAEDFAAYAGRRGAGLVYSLEGRFHRCALDPALAERLVRRFVHGVVDTAAKGETLSLSVGPSGDMCAVSITRPAAIRAVPAEQLLDPAYAATSGERIGIGFALRLVRGLARIAGGDLHIDADQLVMLVPATAPTKG